MEEQVGQQQHQPTAEQVAAQYPPVVKISIDSQELEKLWMGNVYPIMLMAQQANRWDIAFGAILAAHAMLDIKGDDQVINSFSNIQQIIQQLTARAAAGTNEMMSVAGLTQEEYQRVVPRMMELQKQQQQG